MESPEMIKDKYATLSKKYKLPSWEELDKEFQLLIFPPIVEVSNVLFLVYKRMNDKLWNIVNILSQWINPSQQDMLAIKEHTFMSSDDKKEAIKLLTKLMFNLYSNWTSLTPKQQAGLIKTKYTVWIDNKKKYEQLVQKVRNGWEKEHKKVR